ncbi:hypothetical protein [Mesorhizobium sp. M1403]|uniref:hypothetical protein n=1 Tax=Mesorhizobium sp. M1403 TaxID=2957097 RepID=UPI0033379D84
MLVVTTGSEGGPASDRFGQPRIIAPALAATRSARFRRRLHRVDQAKDGPAPFHALSNISGTYQTTSVAEQKFPDFADYVKNSFPNHSAAGLCCIVLHRNDLLERPHENGLSRSAV